jgi:hypothetical protein
MSFDLADKRKLAAAHERGIDVPIKDEYGKPAMQADGTTPITISVVGSLSQRYRRVQVLQRGVAVRAAMNANGVVAEKPKTDEELGAESFADQTAAVAACITGWSPGFTDGGDPFEYSEAHAILLLTENPFIQAQLQAKMADHASFFSASSNRSGG